MLHHVMIHHNLHNQVLLNSRHHSTNAGHAASISFDSIANAFSKNPIIATLAAAFVIFAIVATIVVIYKAFKDDDFFDKEVEGHFYQSKMFQTIVLDSLAVVAATAFYA